MPRVRPKNLAIPFPMGFVRLSSLAVRWRTASSDSWCCRITKDRFGVAHFGFVPRRERFAIGFGRCWSAPGPNYGAISFTIFDGNQTEVRSHEIRKSDSSAGTPIVRSPMNQRVSHLGPFPSIAARRRSPNSSGCSAEAQRAGSVRCDAFS